MIIQVLRTAFLALGVGFMVELCSIWLSCKYLPTFFDANLITILVALLAINTATMGIVLTKIRDLSDRSDSENMFLKTRAQMLLSIKEQISLVIIAMILLSIKSSPIFSAIQNMPLLLNSLITAVFVYSLFVLYDTAKGVLIIIDFKG